MNILMALSQLELTGAEVYAVSLAKGMIKEGHNLFIVSDTLNSVTDAEFISIKLSKRSLFNRIKNIFLLAKIIKHKQIDIVHCHSRAAAWVSYFACKLTGIPYIVTVHGRQSTFKSRKLLKCLGDYTIAVCEELKKQLIEVINADSTKIEVLRNGFSIKYENHLTTKSLSKKVTFITRFTGPKGELAINLIKFILTKFPVNEIELVVVGGKSIPDDLTQYQNRITFIGFVDRIDEYIKQSSVVIASGRTAIESILLKVPTIAIGEAETIGLVNSHNFKRGLETNFGDMAEIEKKFDFEKVVTDIKNAVSNSPLSEEELLSLRNNVITEFDITNIYKRLLSLYRTLYVNKKKKEIPVLMYHRVISEVNEKGVNGIYVSKTQFEEHLQILKKKGFRSLSIDDLISKSILPKENYVIITFDDGYEDNYLNAVPLLQKYGFNACIFMITGLKQNEWDKDSEPKLFRLMEPEQMKSAFKYGIEFGGHTLNHCNLTKTDNETARREISNNKNDIEKILGNELKVFAYPYGEYDERIISIVKEAGYQYAVTTNKGSIALHENPFAIRRIAIFPNTKSFGFRRKIKGDYTFR